MSRNRSPRKYISNFWRSLGPGLISGASDDDPSAIATFSQAGAQFGLGTLWLAIIAFPALALIQEICARIGIVTGKGITGVVRKFYPPWVLYLLVALSCPAFLLNIGADIAALGEAGHLLVPGMPALICSVVFTILLFVLMLLLPYRKLAAVMKFICLVLLVYLVVPFFSKPDFPAVIRNSFIPSFAWRKDWLLTTTGISGAILSPYLFFWQTSSEVEAMAGALPSGRTGRYHFLLMRKDILSGAFFAVLIMYFIILSSGTILHENGIRHIQTIQDAALALRPLAGKMAYALFSLGIIGTACLIIPVLSGTLSYILTEAFNRESGLSRRPREARLFYGIIGAAMCSGIAMHWLNINPVRALLFTTVLYGMTTPFLIGIILHVANNKSIMGPFCNNRVSNAGTILILVVMLTSLFILGYFMFRG